MTQDLILILDLGSEQNSRLARVIRSMGVYSEILAHDITADELAAMKNLKGIALHLLPGIEIMGLLRHGTPSHLSAQC